MKNLLVSTFKQATKYLETLDRRSVAPSPAALANLAQFDEPLPEQPGDPAIALARLDELGSPATAVSAGRYGKVRRLWASACRHGPSPRPDDIERSLEAILRVAVIAPRSGF